MRVILLFLGIAYLEASSSAFAISNDGLDMKDTRDVIICPKSHEFFMTEDLKLDPSFPACMIEYDQEAKSGCCSYHAGVCGCTDTGRALCCDGQPSPSCGC